MESDNRSSVRSISVVIPAYNSEAFIRRAIDSVLKQTRPADEIIVVDDGSADDTGEVVRSFGNQVMLIQQANAGASAARNTGIEAAKSEWIAFLDGDDEWLPDHLQKMTELLGRNPHLVWATANYITCSCDENRQAPYILPQQARTYLHGSDAVADYFQAYLNGLGGHTDTMVIRKTVLMEAGLFRLGQKKANDLDMWWRIAFRYPQIGFLSEPTAIYHLAVEHSISKKPASWRHYADLIKRHQEYAAAFNRLEAFNRFVAKLLRGWIRSMLFQAQKDDTRALLKEFRGLIPFWYRACMWALTAAPKLTQSCCLLLSRLTRLLRFRRRVVLPPGTQR